MILAIILWNALSAVSIALVFEWLFSQGLVTDKPKDILAQMYWVILCLIACACSRMAFLSYLPALPIAFLHISLCKRKPALQFAPQSFLKNLWQEACRQTRRIKFKWEE